MLRLQCIRTPREIGTIGWCASDEDGGTMRSHAEYWELVFENERFLVDDIRVPWIGPEKVGLLDRKAPGESRSRRMSAQGGQILRIGVE